MPGKNFYSEMTPASNILPFGTVLQKVKEHSPNTPNGVNGAEKNGLNPVTPEVSGPVTAPGFGNNIPGVDNTENQARKDIVDDYNKATKENDKVYDDIGKVKGTDINPVNNQDFSKEGRFGSFTGKSFDDTLKLSREADAYNSRPMDQMRIGGSYNAAGGSYDLGQVQNKFEKPRLETQEMREMRRNEALDENQRRFDQELQALVNRKDYDNYTKWYQQKYNMQMSMYEKEQALTTFKYMQKISEYVSQYHDYWIKQLMQHMNYDLAKYITDAGSKGSFIFATYFMHLMGLPIKPAALEDYGEEKLQEAALAMHNATGKDINYCLQVLRNTMSNKMARATGNKTNYDIK